MADKKVHLISPKTMYENLVNMNYKTRGVGLTKTPKIPLLLTIPPISSRLDG